MGQDIFRFQLVCPSPPFPNFLLLHLKCLKYNKLHNESPLLWSFYCENNGFYWEVMILDLFGLLLGSDYSICFGFYYEGIFQFVLALFL
jgi:hypothetical protein